MITIEQALGWLKSLNVSAVSSYWAGTLANKKEHAIGIYPLRDNRPRDIAIGGDVTTKTHARGFSVMVHWDKSTRTGETKAIELYNAIAASGRVDIGPHKVDYIDLLQDEPVWVGADESGTQEYVVEFVIYYHTPESEGEESENDAG